MRLRLFSLLLLLFTLKVAAQVPTCDTSRYRQAIFQVQKDADVVFGEAPAMPAVYIAENVTVNEVLKMDIYQPLGDTLAKRPLLMFAFGGGFLIGAKEDEDARALCDSFARKGYVTASINYRLNMNVADASSGERAVYRAVQDWSAAIRFLKEKSDSLRIDTNYIFAGGVSAGSISAMHCQYMSEAERPASSYASGLPFPAPDLGCKDCSGNSYAHSSRVKALINCWGAIGDTNWIESTENVPMASFHGDLDPVVPYGHGFPFTALFTLPAVDGSSLIHQRQDHLGINNSLVTFPGEGHNVWGTIVANNFVGGPTQYWDPILRDIRDFLWPYVKPTTGTITGLGYVYQGQYTTYTVPAQADHHWCWHVNGGIIVSQNQFTNTINVWWTTLGLGSVSARAFNQLDAAADTAFKYVVVGPVGLADPQDCGTACGLHAYAQQNRLHLAAENLQLGTYSLALLDAQGKTCAQWTGDCNGQLHTEYALPPLAQGIYWLRLSQDELQRSQKILLFSHE